ncbi:hypothetical protein QBC39DRAFT_26199 [Podospora conica]|nr:hypothetical protein QBC39DRAFT_26199 [Schizothecium conicum]
MATTRRRLHGQQNDIPPPGLGVGHGLEGRERLGRSSRSYLEPFSTQQLGSEDTHQRVQNHTLGAVFRSVAAALNNFTIARSRDSPVRGSARLIETVVVVRWPWLAMPLVVEALGLVLLVITMFRKKRAAGLWKDSLLAVLYHGLYRDDVRLSNGESAKTMTDMKMLAKNTTLEGWAGGYHDDWGEKGCAGFSVGGRGCCIGDISVSPR